MTLLGQVRHWRITMQAHLRVVRDEQPIAVNGNVVHETRRISQSIPERRANPPRRQANSVTRTREHLTPDEVERLMTAAAKVGRHGHRDATLILIAYRHGLR